MTYLSLTFALIVTMFCFSKNEPMESMYVKAQQGDVKANQKFIKLMDDLILQAEQGDADAQYKLGHFNLWSPKVKNENVNFTNVVKWFVKSAEQGHPKAQFNLGLFYLGGTGVDRNVALGIEWITKSATQGEENSQYTLAMLHLLNANIAHDDLNEFFKPVSETSMHENKQLQSVLALYYLMGLENIKIDGDTQTAFQWFQKSADQGNIHSQKIIKFFNKNEIDIKNKQGQKNDEF